MSIHNSAGSKSNRYSVLLISILGLAGAICIYYFLFLTSREDMLDKRYFRIMQRMETNITNSVEGHKSLVEGHAFSAKDFLNHGRLSDTIGTVVTSEILNTLRNDKTAPWRDKSLAGLMLDSIWLDTTNAAVDENLLYDEKTDSIFKLTKGIRAQNGMLKFQFRFTVGSVLKSLLRTDAVEEVMLVKDGKIIYETFPSGLEIDKNDSLFSPQVDDKSAAINTIRCGGNRYRVYPQRIKIGNTDGWMLIGLKSMESYSSEKHAIPSDYLLVVFLLVLFSVLALPFVKSLIMSRTERLNTLDVILSCTSVVVSVSIIALLCFDAYLYWNVDKRASGKQLQKASESIRDNFIHEVRAATNELTRYDNYIKDGFDNARKKCDSLQVIQPKNIFAACDSIDKNRDSLPQKYSSPYYSTYTQLYMVDENGKTIYDKYDTKYSFNVSKRRYFQKIMKGKYWYLSPAKEPFYIDAIISWREGTFRAAISKPIVASKNIKGLPKVVALTTELKSITNPIIPDNYAFCLIDDKGNVIFHSDKNKSLNENLLEETDNDPSLIAALYDRADTTINLDYSGEQISAYVSPLDKMPFHLVVFTKKSTLDTSHLQVFGISLSMQLSGLLIYIVLAFLSHISMSYRSRLRIPRFSFAFFLPKADSNHNYNKAILFNFFHGICLFCFTATSGHPVFILYLLLTAPVYSIIYNYHLLSKKRFFVASNYTKVAKRNMYCFVLLVIFVNVTAWFNLDHVGLFFLWQICVAVIFYVASIFNIKEMHIKDYRKSYFLLIYFIILTSCVLPVIRFAGIAFNKEKEILVKLEQLEMARKFGAPSTNYFIGAATDNKLLANYASCFDSTTFTTNTPAHENVGHEELLFDKYASSMRSIIQTPGHNSRYLGTGASDNSWYWEPNSKRLLLTVTSPVLMQQSLKDTVVLSSILPQLRYPMFFGIGESETTFWPAFWFWCILAFLLYVLYRMLCFFVRRLFAPEAFDGNNFSELDHEFFKESQPESRIFVTGIPCSGKSDYFIELYKKENKPFILVDLLQCTDKTAWDEMVSEALKIKDGIIMIDHFEYDSMNPDVNEKKLKLLEQLSVAESNRVVVISAIHPQAFLELYSDPGSAEASLVDKNLRIGEQWSKALASFSHLFYPLQGYKKQCREKLEGSRHLLPAYVSNLIISECQHGNFLCNIGMEFFSGLAAEKNKYKNADPEKQRILCEDIILKIQKLAHVYYLSIWSALTKEEQYVLFDLAQDGVVNSKNMDIMSILVDKGLVTHHAELLPMNKSFRNFILSVIEPADMMKIEQNVRDAGNWAKWKLPLFIFVIALLFFVLQTDQNEIVTYITAFAAGLPFIINLLSSLTQFAGKRKKNRITLIKTGYGM